MSIEKIQNTFSPAVKIFYAEISEISSIDEQPDGSVSVNFNSGKTWNSIYAIPESIKLFEKTVKSDEGNSFAQTLEFTFPGDDIISQDEIDKLIVKKLIIKIDFALGTSKILGTIDNYSLLAYDYSNSDLITSRAIIVSRNSITSAPFLKQ